MHEKMYAEPVPKSNINFNPEPAVKLINAFQTPYDNAVAAARTCYSPKVIYAEDVNKDEAGRMRRDAIARSIYLAGHPTTLQHATFQFVIEKVSRHCIWSFLHSHPFYNSEQVSQRYVTVSPENFATPNLPDEKAQAIYAGAIHRLMDAYVKLQELLRPTVETEFKKIFLHRNLQEKRWQNSLKKRCQEIARYVLPVATHAHLYHTITGITLLRYLRLCEFFDAPAEQKLLVGKMVSEVRKIDPDFLKNVEDSIPIEQTSEYKFFESRKNGAHGSAEFVREFDDSLGGLTSKLADYKVNAETVMSDAVRHTLGLLRAELTDDEAIDLALNPLKNDYLSETMNLNHHSKLSRALTHPHFTFRKKLSHTADSQDQRHRTVPGSRPVLARHFSGKPDYITPQLIAMTPSANALYAETFETLWKNMADLLNTGADLESALYLLPNAFPIRFEESGTLLDFHHKWVHRLCYTAQEEIWKNSVEEVTQVAAVFPRIARHLRAPCALRSLAARKPFCPEGDRFCGVPVWKMGLEGYKRTI